MHNFLVKIPYTSVRRGTYTCLITATTEAQAIGYAGNLDRHQSGVYKPVSEEEIIFNYAEADADYPDDAERLP